jgi:hypothetical protein
MCQAVGLSLCLLQRCAVPLFEHCECALAALRCVCRVLTRPRVCVPSAGANHQCPEGVQGLACNLFPSLDLMSVVFFFSNTLIVRVLCAADMQVRSPAYIVSPLPLPRCAACCAVCRRCFVALRRAVYVLQYISHR